MISCKQIPIPKLEGVDINRIMLFYKMGNQFFLERYATHSWKSFDLIHDCKNSPMMKHFPAINDWVTLVKKHTAIKEVKTLYLSILAPKSSIPWHTDRFDNALSNSYITSIQTDKSFIEFEKDKKYTYKTGYSYIIRTGIKHQIMNLSDDYRITLCTTPIGDNPYASMDN